MPLLCRRSDLNFSPRSRHDDTLGEQTGGLDVGVLDNLDIRDEHCCLCQLHIHYTWHDRPPTTLGRTLGSSTASRILCAPVQSLGVWVYPEESLVSISTLTLADRSPRVLVQILSNHRLRNRVDCLRIGRACRRYTSGLRDCPGVAIE